MLIDGLHGLKKSDMVLLQTLRENAVPHQIVLSKIDRLISPKGSIPTRKGIQKNVLDVQSICRSVIAELNKMDVDGPPVLGDIISCSAESSIERGRYVGVNNLRWSILAATGLSEKRNLNLDIPELATGEKTSV